MWIFGFFLVALCVAAGLRVRRTLAHNASSTPVITDDLIAAIERDGRIVTAEEDEPLDMQEIEEEHRQFWEESSWEEPEQW